MAIFKKDLQVVSLQDAAPPKLLNNPIDVVRFARSDNVTHPCNESCASVSCFLAADIPEPNVFYRKKGFRRHVEVDCVPGEISLHFNPPKKEQKQNISV